MLYGAGVTADCLGMAERWRIGLFADAAGEGWLAVRLRIYAATQENIRVDYVSGAIADQKSWITRIRAITEIHPIIIVGIIIKNHVAENHWTIGSNLVRYTGNSD